MSVLRDMLAVQDDAALTALASVGLLRRARAGLGKGDAIGAVDETADEATIVIENHQVAVSALGPDKARCDCPATGMCRHILMAVLYLRETSGGQQDGPTARAEISALSLTEIEQFAGADWPKAVRIASLPLETAPAEEGRSCVVHLADAPGPVTFVAGTGLRKAVFKGPEGRRKRFVAAAALVLGGHDLPDRDTAAFGALTTEVLDQAEAAIVEALGHGLKGDPHLAQDRLFDVAVSARVDAAPRLAAHLRGASRHAQKLAVRDPDAGPAAYLAMLAECYALTRALRNAPNDPRLTGQLRRDYVAGNPREISVLGVGKWAAPSGARGLTIYSWDGETFLSSGPARAAGSDPTFTPINAYSKPFWPGKAPSQIGGKVFRLPSPRVSVDGVLSQDTVATDLGHIAPEHLPFHDDWRALRADLAMRRGLGLRMSGQPVPALVRFASVDAGWFDQIAQHDVIEVRDRAGQALNLVLPDAACGQVIFDQQSKVTGALIEAVPTGDGITHLLVSVMFGNPLQVWNVTLDQPPKALLESGLMDKMRQNLRKHLTPTPPAPDLNRVEAFATRGLRAIVDGLTFPLDSVVRKQLVSQAGALGLDSISQHFDGLAQDNLPAALDLAWRLVLIRRAALHQ